MADTIDAASVLKVHSQHAQIVSSSEQVVVTLLLQIAKLESLYKPKHGQQSPSLTQSDV